MAQQSIDLSGRAGLADKFYGDVGQSSGSPQLRYLAKNGEMAQGIFNPIRKHGYLAPVPGAYTTVTEADATNAFTHEWRATEFDMDTFSAFAAEDGTLAWGTGTGNLTNWQYSPTALAGTAVRITDLEIYQLNGAKKMFLSYMKSGGGDIVEATMSPTNLGQFSTFNTNWFSTDVSGAFATGATNDVFMRTADNGFMYVFDGAAVHKVDGTTAGGANGTATANVLVFPPGITLVDALDWKGYMWIALQSSALSGHLVSAFNIAGNARTAGVYVWDRLTTSSQTVDFIPMGGVKEIRRLYKTLGGELRAIVISSTGVTQIRRFTGSVFVVMEELGAKAFPTFRDSLGYMGEFVTWLGYDGIIYAHGSVSPGEPEGLYILGDTTATVGASPLNGAILVLDNSGAGNQPRVGILWSAESNAGTIYNRYLYPHSTGTAPLAGDVYTPVSFLPSMSTVNGLTVYCAPTTNTGTTVIGTVSVYFNQSTSAFKTFSVTKTLANRGYIYIPMSKSYVNSIQIKIAWDTGTTIGVDDFLPSVAVVDYTPSTDKG